MVEIVWYNMNWNKNSDKEESLKDLVTTWNVTKMYRNVWFLLTRNRTAMQWQEKMGGSTDTLYHQRTENVKEVCVPHQLQKNRHQILKLYLPSLQPTVILILMKDSNLNIFLCLLLHEYLFTRATGGKQITENKWLDAFSHPNWCNVWKYWLVHHNATILSKLFCYYSREVSQEIT